MQSLILLGFDGLGKSVIDSVMELKQYEQVLVLDTKENIGKTFGMAEVVGIVEDLKEYYDQGYRTVYIANENKLEWREVISEKARLLGFSFATVIDKSALVAADVRIGKGTYVAKGAVVEPSSIIGENVIINVRSIIQSQCEVGDLSRISTAAAICGDAKVGRKCYIGAKSVVTDHTIVPDNTVVENISVYGKQLFEE